MKIIENPVLEVKHKLPWPLHVFLYPTNASGLINLSIFMLLPLLVSSLMHVCLQILPKNMGFMFSYATGIFLILFYITFYSYFFFYFTCCVVDSAKGGIKLLTSTLCYISLTDLILYHR